MKVKSSRLAAALSFIVPGAGLWYLGQWFWAVVNLIGATAMIVLLSRDLQGFEQIHYVFLAIAAGSAGLAHAMTTEHNDLIRIAHDRKSRLDDSSCGCSNGGHSSVSMSAGSREAGQPCQSTTEESANQFPAIDIPTWKPTSNAHEHDRHSNSV